MFPGQLLAPAGFSGRDPAPKPGNQPPSDLRTKLRARVLDPMQRADLAVFRSVAQRELPVLGPTLPVLSRAANRSGFWVVVAGGVATIGGRRGRRAALRGMVSIVVTSLLTDVPGKHLVGRVRPELALVPQTQRLARMPASMSFPSGHAVSAMAFATAMSSEFPRFRVPLVGAAASVGFSRVYTGVHYPADVLVGAAVGTAVARAITRIWPVPERPAVLAETVAARPGGRNGAGLIVVANLDAGSPMSSPCSERLRTLLPVAEIFEADPSDDLEKALKRAASTARVRGVSGGDGSASAGARIAADAGIPLVLVSAGTLNHRATDLGIEDVDSTARAVREGRTIVIGRGEVDGWPFVKSASLGLSPELAAERERYERYLGKWRAFASALVHILATGLIGRTGRSRVSERWAADRAVVRSDQGLLRIASDGEVLPAVTDITVGIRRRALHVLQAAPGGTASAERHGGRRRGR